MYNTRVFMMNPDDVIARVPCCPITMHVLPCCVNWSIGSVCVCVWECNEFITLTIEQRLKNKRIQLYKAAC